MSTLERNKPVPALPTASDVDTSAAYASIAADISRVLAAVDAQKPVWWRRPSFHSSAFRDTAPKWHVFSARRRSGDTERKWDYTWSGLCGYEHTRSDFLGGAAGAVRITAPKRSDRCIRCDNLLVQLRARGRSQQ